MPSASESTAVSVKPGRLRSSRAAQRKSESSDCMGHLGTSIHLWIRVMTTQVPSRLAGFVQGSLWSRGAVGQERKSRKERKRRSYQQHNPIFFDNCAL